MFEQALIVRAGVERQVDLGLFAETLFFYGSTQLLLNMASVAALAKNISHDDLLELLDLPFVKVSYVRPNFAVISAGMPRTHNFGAFTFGSAGKAGPKQMQFQKEVLTQLERTLGKSSNARLLAKRITDKTKLHKFGGLPKKEETICEWARDDIELNPKIHSAMKRA